MKVLNEYPGSHHYLDNYERSDYFCPQCGNKALWVNQGGGDYYWGTDYICTACGGESFLDHCAVSGGEANYQVKLEQLRSGITKGPETPKGS